MKGNLMIKKIASILATLALVVTILTNVTAETKEAEAATSKSISKMTAQEVVDDMGIGWNLGNALDSWNYSYGYTYNTETKWGNPLTTKAMIDKVAQAGFKSIRIPVTYCNHKKNNVIDPKWLDRVEEVVNYALDNDLYVILNVHHDTGMDGWIKADTSSYNTDKANLVNLWKQIAARFKNYSEKLLFEGTNEIINADKNWDWGKSWKDFRCAHDLNQAFIDTVRNSGGKNENRFLVVSTWGASTDSCQIEQLFYKKFVDSADDKLILSVHNYTCTIDKIQPLIDSLASYSKKYKIPIIIGEFGSKASVSLSYRVKSASTYVSLAKEKGITCFWWDDGGNYILLNRKTLDWRFPTIADALIEAAGVHTVKSVEGYTTSNTKGTVFKDNSVKINSNTKITLTCRIKNLSYTDILKSTDNKLAIRLEQKKGIYRRLYWYNSMVLSSSKLVLNEDTTIIQNGRYTKVNGILSTIGPDSFKKLSFSDKGIIVNLNVIDFKNLTIEQDGDIIRNYIPAYDEKGSLCIYDTVTEKYYYASNTLKEIS